MFKNFENFIYSSKDNFPKDECVIQDKNEPDVFHSPKTYLVLWIDDRFEEGKQISYAKPYVWKGENGETGFGWSQERFTYPLGNIENTCQFYNEYVIGFIPVDDNYIQEDIKFFNQCKQIIESQFDE